MTWPQTTVKTMPANYITDNSHFTSQKIRYGDDALKASIITFIRNPIPSPTAMAAESVLCFTVVQKGQHSKTMTNEFL